MPRLLICSLTLLTLGCRSVDMLNATIPASGSVRTRNISYGSLPRQTLDIYRPRDAAPGASIVIFFYGGDWQSGNKEDYRFVAQALTSQGFIAVLPDYRLYPDVQFPAFVQDGALAIKWIHEHAREIGGDRNHLYLMGHSAGAHIAAMLTLDEEFLRQVGLDRSAIRATAALSGPYNFTPPLDDAGVFSMTPSTDAPDAQFEPIHFVDGKEPPMLLVQGLKDKTVNPRNTTDLAEKIRSSGGKVRVIEYADRDHVSIVLSLAWPFRWLAPTLRDVTAFLRSN